MSWRRVDGNTIANADDTVRVQRITAGWFQRYERKRNSDDWRCVISYISTAEGAKGAVPGGQREGR